MRLTSSKPTAAGYGFVPRYTFNFQKGAWYPSARLMANTDFCETNPTSPFVSMPIDLYGKEPKQSKQVVDPQECNQDDALIVATRFTRCILNLSVVGFRALDRRQPCNCLINTRLLTRGLRQCLHGGHSGPVFDNCGSGILSPLSSRCRSLRRAFIICEANSTSAVARFIWPILRSTCPFR